MLLMRKWTCATRPLLSLSPSPSPPPSLSFSSKKCMGRYNRIAVGEQSRRCPSEGYGEEVLGRIMTAKKGWGHRKNEVSCFFFFFFFFPFSFPFPVLLRRNNDGD